MEQPEEIKVKDFYILPTAQDAFDQSSKALNEIDIEIHMSEIANRIKWAIEKKCYAVMLGPYTFEIAEKIALHMQEKYGYSATTMGSGTGTDGKPLSSIALNWKYVPPHTRERLN